MIALYSLPGHPDVPDRGTSPSPRRRSRCSSRPGSPISRAGACGMPLSACSSSSRCRLRLAAATPWEEQQRLGFPPPTSSATARTPATGSTSPRGTTSTGRRSARPPVGSRSPTPSDFAGLVDLTLLRTPVEAGNLVGDSRCLWQSRPRLAPGEHRARYSADHHWTTAATMPSWPHRASAGPRSGAARWTRCSDSTGGADLSLRGPAAVGMYSEYCFDQGGWSMLFGRVGRAALVGGLAALLAACSRLTRRTDPAAAGTSAAPARARVPRAPAPRPTATRRRRVRVSDRAPHPGRQPAHPGPSVAVSTLPARPVGAPHPLKGGVSVTIAVSRTSRWAPPVRARSPGTRCRSRCGSATRPAPSTSPASRSPRRTVGVAPPARPPPAAPSCCPLPRRRPRRPRRVRLPRAEGAVGDTASGGVVPDSPSIAVFQR